MANQYTYNPPFTDEQLHERYVQRGMSQAEIAAEFGVSQHVVQRAMKKMEIPARPSIARNQSLEANNNWRGGRVLAAVAGKKRPYSDRGYWYVHNPDHPNANKSGYVAEHIKVASECAGRPLREGECVHHVNLNKHDNRPENLAIATKRKHAEWHQQLEEIAVALMMEGRITFDSEQGYRLL